MTLGYLGPEGSYSYLAAKSQNSESIKAYTSFYKIFAAIKCGECDAAVIPIENALNGGIMQNLDLLQASERIVATREITVKIDHRLGTKKGADLNKIERVYSHEQALEQCAIFLAEKLPAATQIKTLSTAASLDMVKTDADACIVGSHIKGDGIQLTDYCISDEKNNFTRFLYISKGEIAEDMKSKKVFFSVTCKNVSGGLMSLLDPIRGHGLNMTKIESRPIKDKPDEYAFFIETEGDYGTQTVKDMLAEIKSAASGFKLLGCY